MLIAVFGRGVPEPIPHPEPIAWFLDAGQMFSATVSLTADPLVTTTVNLAVVEGTVNLAGTPRLIALPIFTGARKVSWAAMFALCRFVALRYIACMVLAVPDVALPGSRAARDGAKLVAIAILVLHCNL